MQNVGSAPFHVEPRAPTPELQKQISQRSGTFTNICTLSASPHHGTIRKHKLGLRISVGKETGGLNSCLSSLWPQSLVTKMSMSGSKTNSSLSRKFSVLSIKGVSSGIFSDSWDDWEVDKVLGLRDFGSAAEWKLEMQG